MGLSEAFSTGLHAGVSFEVCLTMSVTSRYLDTPTALAMEHLQWSRLKQALVGPGAPAPPYLPRLRDM